MVEQYRRVAYTRYAIISMGDRAALMLLTRRLLLIKAVVAMRGWLLFRKLKSIVIMYGISMVMHTTWMQIWLTLTISVCSWYTKLRLMQGSSIGDVII